MTTPCYPLQCNPSEQDLCEDMSDLQSINECGVLHTLLSRAKANLPLTHAGPNLVNFWPPLQTHSKVTNNVKIRSPYSLSLIHALLKHNLMSDAVFSFSSQGYFFSFSLV